jgi:nanoRNase/pAp phosphatase (c-di-AMP/oligoRNAs hydrolase)
MSAKTSKDTKTRVKELLELVSNKPKLLILVHPDPDSMASAIALRRIILRKCSKIVIAYGEAIKRIQNRAMAHLLKIKMVNIKELRIDDFDLLAVVDGQWDHFPILAHRLVDICIDHHPIVVPQNYKYADIRPEVGATSSILWDYLECGKIKISKSLATALCYGIKTDTDNFTRSVHKLDAIAFSRLFPIADYYLLRSIDLVEISARDLDQFRATLAQLNVKRKKTLVHLGQAPNPDLLVIIADFLIRVSEIETVLVSGVFADRLIVILRNRNPRQDIGMIAKRAFEQFGNAGGHRYAARAEIRMKCLPRSIQRHYGEETSKWLEMRISSAKSKASRRRGRARTLCAP